MISNANTREITAFQFVRLQRLGVRMLHPSVLQLLLRFSMQKRKGGGRERSKRSGKNLVLYVTLYHVRRCGHYRAHLLCAVTSLL